MKARIFSAKASIAGWIFVRRNSFRYLKDRLFWAAVVIYFLNRCFMKPWFGDEVSFFSCYLNDLICFPFWLPIVLFFTRGVRLRMHDGPPDVYELGFYLLLWSFMFEYVAPSYGRYFNNMVADPWDILFYAVGALVGGLWWNFAFERSLRNCLS